MKTESEKTYKFKVSVPPPEEAEKLRQIIKEVEEENKQPVNPDEWEVVRNSRNSSP